MYAPVQRCLACGANLTLDDLRSPNCRYCGTVLPHRAQAEQHAQLAGQMMNQMIAQQAQIQDQWRAGYGMGGGQFSGGPVMPPPPGSPGSPYADPQRIAAAHMARVTGMSRMITFVILGVVVMTLVFVAAIVLFVMVR
jgi:hypothetical protein